jgi:hypothetical protein
LCHNKRLHPVASSSGYVFCFRCLVMYMRMHGPRCPVTGLFCTESNLIRLYEPSTTNASSSTNTYLVESFIINSKMTTAKKTFVIEHCENCQIHNWCTRHDANLYKQHAIN